MRKIFAFVAATALLYACSKENEEIVPENVTFKLSYSMDKGTSMTRTGEEAYNSFYENFVKTKAVGYPKYDLTFYKGENAVATIKGEWEATLVTLPEGTYTVKGTSESTKHGIWDEDGISNDQHSTLSLVFDEDITITKEQTTISLHPEYSCYLIFADAQVIPDIKIQSKGEYSGGRLGNYRTLSFFDAGNIKYAFINSHSWAENILYTTTDGDSGTLNIKTLGFEIGNYYCLDAVATGYQVPPMDNGF